jgi:outer membrane cobalamin receptor
MIQSTRKSGFRIIRFLLILFLHLSFVFFNLSFAIDVPRFYGEEVVVTALRIPRLKSAIPWTTKVITREDIEKSTAVKLGDILRSVSGLSIKANGGLNSQISARLRGASSQQVLVLLNGNRINSPTLGTFDLGDILLTDVERIEVIKAPLSAVYGADALGGVINIITRKATEARKLEVSAAYGDFSTQNYSLAASGPNYFFSAVSLSSDGFRDNADYQALDFDLRLFGRMGKTRLEAGMKNYKAEKGSPGSLDFLTPQARQKDNNLFFDVGLKAEEIGLNTSVSQAILDQRYENEAWGLLTTTKTTTTNFNIEKVIELTPAQTLLLGLDVRNDKSRGTGAGDQELNNNAIYFQNEIDIPRAAKLIIGARQDSNDAYGDYFNPRIGCVLNPGKDLFLKLSWGTSFKAPTINDLYWTRITEPGWPTGVITTEGNPDLKPEKASSFEITLERELETESLARISYYQTEITDMIRWTNISSSLTDAFWTPVNISDASIHGVEFEYKRSLFNALDAFINLTYQSAKDKATEKDLDYAPNIQYNFGLTHSRPGVTSNLLIKYVGERYSDLSNTNKLPSYTVVDLSFLKEYGRLRLKLDVGNLFNEKYAETYGFSDVYPMAGRRYNIGVSYKF